MENCGRSCLDELSLLQKTPANVDIGFALFVGRQFPHDRKAGDIFLDTAFLLAYGFHGFFQGASLFRELLELSRRKFPHFHLLFQQSDLLLPL